MDTITFDEDDYQYDYNAIFPDYFDPNISDFMFGGECPTAFNSVEVHSNSNSNSSSANNNSTNISSDTGIIRGLFLRGGNGQNGIRNEINDQFVLECGQNNDNINCSYYSNSHNNSNDLINISDHTVDVGIATDPGYSIINLDSNIHTFPAGTDVLAEYTSEYNQAIHIEQHPIDCSSIQTTNAQSAADLASFADHFAANNQVENVMSGEPSADGYLCPNDFVSGDSGKFMPPSPAKMLDTNVDFMFVSSDGLIDTEENVILDLTNDEVDRILDDNLISAQDLNMIGGASSGFSPEMQPCKRLPRINIATNLTKAFADVSNEFDGKLSNVFPVEEIFNIVEDHADDVELLNGLSTVAEVIEQSEQNGDDAGDDADYEEEGVEECDDDVDDENGEGDGDGDDTDTKSPKKTHGRAKGARQMSRLSNNQTYISSFVQYFQQSLFSLVCNFQIVLKDEKWPPSNARTKAAPRVSPKNQR